MYDKINELYVQNGYTLRVTMDILWCVYQFAVRYVIRDRKA